MSLEGGLPSTEEARPLAFSKNQLRARLASVIADLTADDAFHWERLALSGLLAGETFPQTYAEYKEACYSILGWIPGEKDDV